MIPLELFDYSKNKEIDVEVTKYINENLKCMVRVVLDMLEDNNGFDMDGFLPQNYLKKKPEECRNLVDELYAIIDSKIIRDYIKPKYEYLLYAILCWWEDCADNDDELIPRKIENHLLNKIKIEPDYIIEEEYNYILNAVTNFEEFYNICFYDHDFLSSSLEKMVTIYLRSTEIFELWFPDVDLNDYSDLMTADLQELFYEKTNSVNTNYYKAYNNIDIINEFRICLECLEQRIAEIENRSEVEISNDIYAALQRILYTKFELQIVREATIGRANKKLGETDLYAFKHTKKCREDFFIVENKCLEKFDSQYEQLLGYLNKNFKFGITISINKNKPLDDAINFIRKHLLKLTNIQSDFKITTISEPIENCPYLIKSTHNIPEILGKQMDVYHLILNVYDKERKEVAISARKK